MISEQDFVHKEKDSLSEDIGLGWSGNHAGESRGEGCRSANFCCQGKDNKCFARGRKVNGGRGEICYCDSQCLTLNDCCWDYKENCPALDCQLDNWVEWSECDSKCGFGMRQRSRSVSREAQNGGKPCEAINQKQVCEGIHCKLTRDSDFGNELRETGRILPIEFSRWRNDKLYDPYKDIRRNLFFKYRETPFRSTTCSTYTLQSVHRLCRAEPVSEQFRSLKKGAQVCVECHSMAALDYLGGRCFGQGAHKRETRWSFLGKVGCRGTWVMESKMEECTCSSRHAAFPSFSFI